jgi:DNA invertase Pin-like site-specific DNA recombinase
MDIGKQAVGYLRGSTAEQGRSGNGLAAQRSANERFAQMEDFTTASWFEEWLHSV